MVTRVALSTLILIRHGQASFGAANYDVLSELGIRQAQTLGSHLAGREVSLDAIYTGPAERQKDTALHMRTAASEAGTHYPVPTELSELDEYPAFELFKKFLPILRDQDPELASMLSGGNVSSNASEVFSRISQKWARGELDTGELETFAAFESRVNQALDEIRSRHGRGVTVGVVTSGGPIAVAVKRCLELAPDKAIAIAWVVVNSAIIELAFSSDRLGLVALNRIPHLPNDLITRR